ncbi:hypothetical protein OG762_03580 [Streptomyces sp. NBC_01136]|uniref:alpha-L-rhamnosidase C-terminal domain-containing protein n=1 Tax=unclassified Streptomyces TaxID=2593676 RepID=UPI00324962A1|nr:hypothetical protein OG762_03580 [Streptomyces sp. NBC_01136]
MDSHDPGVTNWEGIGPNGSLYEDGFTSMAHGWSTGVLPALTHELLGAQPTSPGYTAWKVSPHPGSVAWAQGELPTPHGPLRVAWTNSPAQFKLTVHAPKNTAGVVVFPQMAKDVVVRVNGSTVWDGHRAARGDVKVVDGHVTITAPHAGAHHFTATPR